MTEVSENVSKLRRITTRERAMLIRRRSVLRNALDRKAVTDAFNNFIGEQGTEAA